MSNRERPEAETLPSKHNENNWKLFQLYELKVKTHIIEMISLFSETEKGQPHPT